MTLHALRRPHLSPVRLIILMFVVAIVVGTGLLMLPISYQGQAPRLLEAGFTATSAITVTGLIVVDTPEFWTLFGQVVILILIKMGGLGVMTFATVLGMLISHRMGLTRRLETAAESRTEGIGDLRRVLLAIFTISSTIELSAAVVLFLRYWLGHGVDAGLAAWYGLFHAVSAFNNAGFALHSDSLMGYVGDPYISLTVVVCIVLGGIGFPVLVQLLKFWRIPHRWNMNTRLMMLGTVLLVSAGTAMYLLLEWSNPRTLGSLDVPSRILAAFFQSVTTRTAGFNTLDFGQMDPITLMGTDVLMFIGGGPGGTAGGLKVTTFGVLFFIMLTELRGENAVNVLGRRLARSAQREATTVVLLSVAAVTLGTAGLMALSEATTDQLLFEAVSAFATVGLSTGVMADLPDAGQAILMVLMFLGRLGPATVAGALALRQRKILYELPKERPLLG
ncbi:TrkH family potassium uptake protein [Citricoccus sp. GCM10030269]|uniref:TrkH family potassium uptake protein n=1 Tax=Citricoccus sp. GCM10030269 TaxID=3273388 RepID=UPI003618CF9C